jgi:hypothetical protein
MSFNDDLRQISDIYDVKVNAKIDTSIDIGLKKDKEIYLNFTGKECYNININKVDQVIEGEYIIFSKVKSNIIQLIIDQRQKDEMKKIADSMKKRAEEEKNKTTNSTTKSVYNKTKDELNKDLPEFTVKASKPMIKGGTYIIDMKNPNSKDVTVIWGGMPSSQYGAKYMREKATGYFNNKNVIYSNYENSLETLKTILKNKGIKDFRIKSVSGFSRGGINAWGQINGTYDFIGLIDPSTPTAYGNLPSKAKMISRWENWGCCPSYRKNIKSMEDKKVSQRIPSTGYNHLDMPEIFYKKYSNLM